MYKRLLQKQLEKHIQHYQYLTLLGPSQSGKTTLSINTFPEYEYFSLESPDVRDRFEYDPRGFFEGIKDNAILMKFRRSPGGDAGITQPTVKSWVSALETTYICFTLQPHFKNFNKRMTKAPKVYFYDTGLLCYLLRIKNAEQLRYHPLKGAIFENWIIVETIKKYLNQGVEAPVYFWRDQHGHEVDLVLDEGTYLDLAEIKSGGTFQKEFLKNLTWLNKLQNREAGKCVYGGDKTFQLGDVVISSWKDFQV